MNRYKALLQERADLVKQAKALFDAAEADARDLTDDEKAQDDAINLRLEALGHEIDREERRRANERLVSAVTDANQVQAQRGLMAVRDLAEDDPKHGFANIADFALAVKQASQPGGYVDQRLHIGAAPTSYHQETGAGEGYMVPPQMRQEVWDIVWNGDSLLNAVETEPTAGNYVEFVKDETTPWGSTGVQAKWRAEATQMTATKLVTEAEQMRLHELYAFVTATDELLQDAPRLNARLTRKAGEAIRYKVNEAIVNGTGAGQPLGWFASGALVTVAKESGQTATTVVAANVAKMFSRVINPGQATWYINQDVLPQLMTMTLGQQPIWTPPASGFVNAPGGFLFGRPVQFLENCATLGTVGDIQLVNGMGYYAITKTGGPEFASSIHLFFDYGIQAFRWMFRLNGQPYLSAPVSPAKGSSTRSHFVALATRS